MEQRQPLPVGGYTPQSDERIGLVNQNKVLEERVLRCIDELVNRHAVDGRWAAVARTHIEEGFMALNRAVFKPQRLTDADIAKIADR